MKTFQAVLIFLKILLMDIIAYANIERLVLSIGISIIPMLDQDLYPFPQEKVQEADFSLARNLQKWAKKGSE